MVLAAGFGTRLRPLTYLRAKPAVPLLGRPLIQYVLDRLVDTPVRNIIINLHHLPSTVMEAASRTDVRIHFSKEAPILGTAGALSRVRDRLRDASVILVNGKIYTEEHLRHVVEFHRRKEALVTLMVRPWWPDCPFNPVLVDADLRIHRFSRTRPGHDPSPLDPDTGLRPFVFTGVHVLEPEVVERIGDGFSDTVADLYPPLIAEGRRILAFVSDRCWFETSTPERYLARSIELLRRQRGATREGTSQTIAAHTDTVYGERNRIGPEVRLEKCILWDRVELSGAVSAVRTVFTEDVRVFGEREFRDCIVTPRSSLLDARAREHDARIDEGFICWPMQSPAEMPGMSEVS